MQGTKKLHKQTILRLGKPIVLRQDMQIIGGVVYGGNDGCGEQVLAECARPTLSRRELYHVIVLALQLVLLLHQEA